MPGGSGTNQRDRPARDPIGNRHMSGAQPYRSCNGAASLSGVSGITRRGGDPGRVRSSIASVLLARSIDDVVPDPHESLNGSICVRLRDQQIVGVVGGDSEDADVGVSQDVGK